MSGIEIFLSLKDARFEAQPFDGHEISNASAELSVPGMFHITIYGSAPDWHRLALWAEECAQARKSKGKLRPFPTRIEDVKRSIIELKSVPGESMDSYLQRLGGHMQRRLTKKRPASKGKT